MTTPSQQAAISSNAGRSRAAKPGPSVAATHNGEGATPRKPGKALKGAAEKAKHGKLKDEKQKKQKKAKKAKPLSAKTADIHQLYERSVQDPDSEVAILHRVFRKLSGRRALSLREDFCGTAYLCASWVSSHLDRTATGVDLDGEVLASGRARHIEPLGDAARRVTLLQEDVRALRDARFDIVCAYNFSYWIFTTRQQLREYFAAAREALVEDGVFALDAYGGTEAMEAREEARKIAGGFTYVWDQAEFNPIDHSVVNHIHFRFKDGTKLNRAFTYAWRFWTLPEIQELLLEAGFSEVSVYWDIADDDEDADYRPRKVVENQLSWVCYLMARR